VPVKGATSQTTVIAEYIFLVTTSKAFLFRLSLDSRTGQYTDIN